ncbi:MAG: TIR domain-containing protein [Proteobacteria bacterium]|nr:TIR domain-containing protein [Pseudomonadota bacterium]
MTTAPGGEATTQASPRAIFLSYASEDSAAAERICEALRAAGIEVWFDRSALRGGDAWDAAIRRQIKSCALFIPLISRNSHSRAEGYFRLEWKLAVDRSHLIAADRVFLLPISVDDTDERDDRVPDRFREVQWLRLPGGHVPPDVVARIARLLAEAGPEVPAAARASTAPAAAAAPIATPVAAAPAPAPARTRTRSVAIAAAALLVLAGGGLAARHYLGRTPGVVPYSAEDRRMSFAVLPFEAPSGDPHAAEIAKATGEAVAQEFDAHPVLAQAVPHRLALEASSRSASAHELARTLNVHFLVRGAVARSAAGYTVSVAVIEGENERTLTTRTLDVAADAVTPRWHDDLENVVFRLAVAGVEAEVAHAADRPVEALDVRDLSFRALVNWRSHRGADAKQGYDSATALIDRALTLAPNDPLATYLTAWINLCDCVMAWSTDVEVQKAKGQKALERYLAIDPNDPEMISDKASLFQLRGRWEEALTVIDTLLQRDPDNANGLAIRASSLLHLGQVREGTALMDGIAARYPTRWPEATASAANFHYLLGDYAGAVERARNAIPRMNDESLKSPIDGVVQLTLAAAEARLGHRERARAALADLQARIPAITTLSAARKWVFPTADVAGAESLYEGLRLTGLPD